MLCSCLYLLQVGRAYMARRLCRSIRYVQRTRAGTSAGFSCWNSSTTRSTTAAGFISQSTVSYTPDICNLEWSFTVQRIQSTVFFLLFMSILQTHNEHDDTELLFFFMPNNIAIHPTKIHLKLFKDGNCMLLQNGVCKIYSLSFVVFDWICYLYSHSMVISKVFKMQAQFLAGL